jgi:hypothetical protein
MAVNTISRNGWLMIAILVAIAATFFIWHSVASHPDLVILGTGGDATKNYYTYLYQSLYGKGLWFKGMNYPYGEHIAYIDGQPMLSVPLSYLRQYMAIDRGIVLAVMHLAILLAYALGIVYIYKTLVHYKVSASIAIVFSIFIQLLSPQVFRMFAHYGLSYACIIPMLLYWSVKLYETGRVRYAAYVFLLGSIMSFFHPYLAAIVLVWGVFYAISILIVGRKQKLRQAVPMLIAVLSMALLVKGVMYLTDPVTDRPAYPSGILSYGTTGQDIFTSPYSPVWQLLVDKDDHKIVSAGGEGHAYMGLAAILLVIVGITSLFMHRRQSIKTEGFPPVFLLLALFALLLSMGVPFVWGMEWLLDYFSAFRQFRTLGRFSWIWYYILAVYAVIILYGYYSRYKAQNKKVAAYSVLISAILLWGVEANGHRQFIAERCDPTWDNYAFLFSHSEPDWNRKLQGYGYKSSDFQAILSLPYYHLGSDKLWQYYDEVAWLQVLTCKASLQLALPYANAFMARSSWSQTFAQVKIQGGPYVEKALLQTKDERPLLVFTRVTDSIFNPDQKYVLDACEYIGEKEDDMKAFKLYPSILRKKDSMYRALAKASVKSCSIGDTAFNIPENGFWYINHFDTSDVAAGLWGKGMLSYKAQHYRVVADVQLPVADTGMLYEFSTWVLLDSVDYRSPYFELECYGATGEPIKYRIPVHQAQDTKGMWVRAAKYVMIPAGCNRIRCVLFNDPENSYLAADELMLRQVDALVISKDKDGKAMVNNHEFKW